MIFRSPFPDVDIPVVPLAPFVLRHADRLAGKAALIDASSGQILTYGELATSVRDVAGGLTRHGFGKGDVLGIYASNCPDYAIALLAVVALGGIVTPVSHLATCDELNRQLTDAGASFLLTTPALLDTAHAAMDARALRGIFVIGKAPGATSFDDLRCKSSIAFEVSIDPAHDVVVLPYSSGTTGGPKGVMLTHRNLVANICQMDVPQHQREDDVVFCLPPFSHQYGLFLVLWTLASGATLVSLPRFDLAGFLGGVERQRVTRAYLVPPVILALANDPIVDQFDLSTLGVINSGAAPLSTDLIRRCGKRLSCRIIQGLGMTEASPVTHAQRVHDESPKLGAIGTCVPNTECKVIDVESGTELGPNQQGELWIRGPQVMAGYLNRPDATAQTVTSDGWLRTGDLGFADDDGEFTIIDRLKELIKYKAYQVAPAELEAILIAHPAVSDCAVIPSPDERAGEVPKAFIVLRGVATADALMAYVAEQVAPYKKVRRLEFVDQIPKSPSGKILRRVLIERERAALAAPVLA